jgi:hypothetical protein
MDNESTRSNRKRQGSGLSLSGLQKAVATSVGGDLSHIKQSFVKTTRLYFDTTSVVTALAGSVWLNERKRQKRLLGKSDDVDMHV